MRIFLSTILLTLSSIAKADLFDRYDNRDPIAEARQSTLEPFGIDHAIKVALDDLKGWSKVDLFSERGLWMPTSFLKNTFMKDSDPQAWLSKVKQMKFCEPDEMWKTVPVFYSANDSMSGSFQNMLVSSDASTVNYSFSQTVGYNGKFRTVTYNMSKGIGEENSPIVKVNCSAKSEDGNSHFINQEFNLNQPDSFKVFQKKVLKDGRSILI